MGKHPRKSGNEAVREPEPHAARTAEPRVGGSPFFSFRYSYTEISASGGRARVKSRRALYENGKLASESFDGELDAQAYDHMIRQAQQYLRDQTTPLVSWLSSIWNFGRLR